jgi:signal transduction histidine kinase
LARNIPSRVHEREFWITQAGVFGVTAIHILLEMWIQGLHDEIPSVLHHIPVVMYLAPIAYASLKFGTEGAVLTGLLCALLTLPNLFIWHSADLEWLEVIYVAAVIVAGVAMSIPVERERAQRKRAEATTQRLGLLNKIATLTLTADLQTTVDETLRKLGDMLDLQAVCIALFNVSGQPTEGPTVLACRSRAEPYGAELQESVRQLRSLHGSEDSPVHDPSLTVVPLQADLPGSGPSGLVEGFLAAQNDPVRPLIPNDIRLLEGVASHLAVAIANERLSESERDRIRSYTIMMTQAQEDERKRIARELHDEASQNVVVIRRALADLSSSLDGHPAARELSELDKLAGETLVGIRRFSRDLRPPTLDQLGLSSALEQLVVELEERSAVDIDLQVAGASRRLPIDKELAVFRIGQAALHNVERHADADTITIELIFEPEKIRLEISDDGCGFEVPDSLSQILETGKLGIVGMHERAELAGGNLEIRSEPGKGTRVSLEVPG